MSGSQLTMGNFEARLRVASNKSHADVRPYQRRMRRGWHIGLCPHKKYPRLRREIFIRRERAFCVDKRLRG